MAESSRGSGSFLPTLLEGYRLDRRGNAGAAEGTMAAAAAPHRPPSSSFSSTAYHYRCADEGADDDGGLAVSAEAAAYRQRVLCYQGVFDRLCTRSVAPAGRQLFARTSAAGPLPPSSLLPPREAPASSTATGGDHHHNQHAQQHHEQHAAHHHWYLPHKLVPYAMRLCGLIVVETHVLGALKQGGGGGQGGFRGRRVRRDDFVGLCEEVWASTMGSPSGGEGGGGAADGLVTSPADSRRPTPPPEKEMRPAAASQQHQQQHESAVLSRTCSSMASTTTASGDSASFLTHVLGRASSSALLADAMQRQQHEHEHPHTANNKEEVGSGISFGHQHYQYLAIGTKGLIDGLFAAFDGDSDYNYATTTTTAAVPSSFPSSSSSSRPLPSPPSPSDPLPVRFRPSFIPLAVFVSIMCRHPTEEGLMGQWMCSGGFKERDYAQLLTSLDRQLGRHEERAMAFERRQSALRFGRFGSVGGGGYNYHDDGACGSSPFQRDNSSAATNARGGGGSHRASSSSFGRLNSVLSKGAVTRSHSSTSPDRSRSRSRGGIMLMMGEEEAEEHQHQHRHHLPQFRISSAIVMADTHREGVVDYRRFAYLVAALIALGDLGFKEYAGIVRAVEVLITPEEAAGRDRIRRQEEEERRAFMGQHAAVLRLLYAHVTERKEMGVDEASRRGQICAAEAAQRGALIDLLFTNLKGSVEREEALVRSSSARPRLFQLFMDGLDRAELLWTAVYGADGLQQEEHWLRATGCRYRRRRGGGDGGGPTVVTASLRQEFGSDGRPCVGFGTWSDLLALMHDEEQARHGLAQRSLLALEHCRGEYRAALPHLILRKRMADVEGAEAAERLSMVTEEAGRRFELYDDLFDLLFTMVESEESVARTRLATDGVDTSVRLFNQCFHSALLMDQTKEREAFGWDEEDGRDEVEGAEAVHRARVLGVFFDIAFDLLEGEEEEKRRAIEAAAEESFNTNVNATERLLIAVDAFWGEEQDCRYDIEDEADDELTRILTRFAAFRHTEDTVVPMFDPKTIAAMQQMADDETDARYDVEDEADDALTLILTRFAAFVHTEEAEVPLHDAKTRLRLEACLEDESFEREDIEDAEDSALALILTRMATVQITEEHTEKVPFTAEQIEAERRRIEEEAAEEARYYAAEQRRVEALRAKRSAEEALDREFAAEAQRNADTILRKKLQVVEEDEHEDRLDLHESEEDALTFILARFAAVNTVEEHEVPLLSAQEVKDMSALFDAEDSRRCSIEDEEARDRRASATMSSVAGAYGGGGRGFGGGRSLPTVSAVSMASSSKLSSVSSLGGTERGGIGDRDSAAATSNAPLNIANSNTKISTAAFAPAASPSFVFSAKALVEDELDEREEIEDAADGLLTAILMKMAAVRITERRFAAPIRNNNNSSNINNNAHCGTNNNNGGYSSSDDDDDDDMTSCASTLLLGGGAGDDSNASFRYFRRASDGSAAAGDHSSSDFGGNGATAAAAATTTSGLVSVPSILVKSPRYGGRPADLSNINNSIGGGNASIGTPPLSPRFQKQVRIVEGGGSSSSYTNAKGCGASGSSPTMAACIASTSSFALSSFTLDFNALLEEEQHRRSVLEDEESEALDRLLLRMAYFTRTETTLYEVIERKTLQRFLNKEQDARYAIEDSEDEAFRKIQLRFMILRTAVETAEVPVDLLCDIIGCGRSDLIKANMTRIVPATRDYIDATTVITLPPRKAPETADQLSKRLGVPLRDLVRLNAASIRSGREVVMGAQRLSVLVSTMGQRVRPPTPSGSASPIR